MGSSATTALILRLRVRKHGKDKTKPSFLVAATHLKALPSESGYRVGNGGNVGQGVQSVGQVGVPSVPLDPLSSLSAEAQIL